MTDIQPSPPGYRGQDETPGPISCSPGSFKYAGHAHHAEHKQQQQQSTGNYVKSTASTYNNQESYSSKQSNEQQNVGYRRKSENSGGRRSNCGENEPSVDTNNKKSNITSYNEGYKKNTPGYKNDSGYSESIGFDSFSLPLNERDDASPPPTPPVRDASSLKGVCYGPGHEKYPSWPSAPERHTDEESSDEINGHVGSHRSKSWTDHTNYPKEKPAQYTRPLVKRPNPAFTQQLKTVMERCEKIPAETFESRGTRVNAVEEEPRLWPRVDREGKPLGDAEYVVPSPPEREQQQPSQTISHAELEAYVRSYQDPQVSQVDVYRETALTQAGLEEYTRVQHSQQASYAQSEGYHSYVSSVDSTTNTPFLDRLRRDSEAVAQRPSSTWEEGSREGRDSVVTTSSGGSASSSETLKWHGSMSDVSVSSGLPARHQANNDRWDRGSMSDVSSVNGSGTSNNPQKPINHREKWQSSISNITGTLLNSSPRHARRSNCEWKRDSDKWQTSMNDRNCKESTISSPRKSLPAVMSHCSSVGDVHEATLSRDGKWQESSIDEDTQERKKVSQRIWESSISIDNERYSSTRALQTPESRSPLPSSGGTSNLENSIEWTHGSMSDVSQSNLAINSSKQLIAHSARVQTPQRHHSESVLYLDRERSQRKLYPVATCKPQESANQSSCSSRRTSPVSPQQAHLSVAERISELEKAQQTRYTYLDPEKRHRVSDPTLKAIQKKALLSFYERHHHQSSWRSEPQLAQGSIVPNAQSPPPQPPPRPRPSSSRRASSASDYSSGAWREKTSRPLNSTDLTIPKHQHSNSCGSLSTDLLGPVIVGPAISIDDWVPERPPKKPHLRGNAFNERVPSPDLPPPSPPTVDETEVLNCDDPLPPPPPELSDTNCENRETSGQPEKRHGTSSRNTERQSRRSKHGKRHDRDDDSSKSSTQASATKILHGKSQQSRREDSPASSLIVGLTKQHETDVIVENGGASAGFTTHHRIVQSGRSSLRYPAGQRILANGRLTSSRRSEERLFASRRPPARLPDLVSQRYSDSGNQRPAPQVPVESTRIIRQESMRVESTRIDASGLLRNETSQRYESSTGQRPQPQVPKCNNNNSSSSEKITKLASTLQQQQQQVARPNYLAIADCAKTLGKYCENGTTNYSVGSPVKTGYEASSKLMAEASPQKYHEPPKYTAGHHQRHGDTNQRYSYALATKYADLPKQKPQPQCPNDRYETVNSSGSPPPPPLAPRQNTPGRKSLPPPPRPAPPHSLQGSQSKASYLAYRRERGAPDSEGSYKRTMSPTARLDDWHNQNSGGSRDHDDPVLLRVTPHHSHQSPNHQTHSVKSQANSQPIGDLPKSHSVDALHQRIEERNSVHSSDVITKLSRDLTKKLQSTDNRGRNESNNNNNSSSSNSSLTSSDKDYRERLSPQSIEVLNDRNRQLERERRKLAASCEPLPRLSSTNGEATSQAIEDFYRERSATIEMTSRNVELLNRRNALAERRIVPTTTGQNVNGNATASSPMMENSLIESRNHAANDKPSPPINSPPRSPSTFSPSDDTSPGSLRTIRGAVPRRSESCSSSSSTSTRSSNEANQTSISSPRNSHKNESLTRQEERSSSSSSSSSSSNVVREIDEARSNCRGQGGSFLGRKISSPSQTENSWTVTNSPRARSSQTEVTITNARLRGISSSSSSRSRSSSLSSAASKISTSSSSSSVSPRYSPIEAKTSPCVSPQPGIEGLTLVQRSEIVLRVNSTTIDASSQTEIFDDDDCNDTKNLANNGEIVAAARRKLPEEIECEELSRDLASQLGPNDKLVPILLPAPEHKKPTDYVSGLFRVEATLQPRPRRPPSLNDFNSANSADNENEDDAKNETMPSTPTTPLSTTDPSSPLSPTSAYFTTSEGKARFLTRYSRDVTDEDISKSSDNSTRSNATNNANDSLDLRQKKEELVLRLDKKVVVLRAEQEAVREEGDLNEALGARVSTRVSAVARPAEASKYRLHVEEVGKITSLLLGLSGRLARAENALYGMPADHPERKILESKRDKLMDQLEEAKILKSNIDKRSVNVSAILSKYLNDDEYADYQHFINMKAKLIMDGREIQDKVKLGEEQLAALKEAID